MNGDLLENLEKNRMLSVHSVQGVPVPNIFMPPLYPIFLYCVKFFFQNIDLFLWVIQYIQLLFALISVYLTYKIYLNFFQTTSADWNLIYNFSTKCIRFSRYHHLHCRYYY